MFEYEILFSDGVREIIFGYSLDDACRRYGRKQEDVKKVYHKTYID